MSQLHRRDLAARLMLLLVLTGAAVLRFVGLDAGIPYAVGVDEPEIVERAVRMMRSGDPHPHFFDYPSLYIYVQVAVASARFLAGAIAGEWRSLEEAASADFYLWGRATTAAFGTLTVLLVYHVGRRWSPAIGLVSAVFLAVMPLHVRESHYVLTDVPEAFFVVLTWLLALRASEEPRLSRFAWAGAAAGLAAATKYPGGLALLLPLAAVAATPGARMSRGAAVAAVVLSAAVCFLAAAPYTVLDLPAFLNGFAALMAHYHIDRGQEAPWLLYVKHLRNAVQWPALIVMAAGLAAALGAAARGPHRVRWMLAAAFPIAYMWLIASHSLVFGRYLVPLLPFLCVLAAAVVVHAVDLVRRAPLPRPLQAASAVLAIGVLAGPSAAASIEFNRTIVKPSTLTQAYDWIAAHVPGGASIVIESNALVLRDGRYKTRNVPRLRDRQYAEYREAGVEYIVASSYSYGPYLDAPHLFPREYADYMRIFEQSREVARFVPSTDRPGPELRILRLGD